MTFAEHSYGWNGKAHLTLSHLKRGWQALIRFVPNNDSNKIFYRQDRLTSKVASPHHLTIQDDLADGKQAVHFLWPIPEREWTTASHYAQLLSRESQNLMALGMGNRPSGGKR